MTDDDEMDYVFYVGLPLLLKMVRFDLVLLFDILLKQFHTMIDNDNNNNNDNSNNNSFIDNYNCYDCRYSFFGIQNITPLYIAIRYNRTKVVEYLLDIAFHNPACCRIIIKSNNNNNSDHRHGISICKMMLTQTWIDSTNLTPIELSILCGNNNNRFIKCLDKWFDHMLKCNYNNNNNTNISNFDYNQELIKRSLINRRTDHMLALHGCYLIHFAIKRRLDKMVQLLLKYGANVNASSTSSTPLRSTIWHAFDYFDDGSGRQRRYTNMCTDDDKNDKHGKDDVETQMEKMKTKYLNIFKTIVWNKNVLIRFKPGASEKYKQERLDNWGSFALIEYQSHLMTIVAETRIDLNLSTKNKNDTFGHGTNTKFTNRGNNTNRKTSYSLDCTFKNHAIIKKLACDMFEVLIERIIYDEKNNKHPIFFTIDTILKDRDYFDVNCNLFMYAARYGQYRILKILLNILNQAKQNGYFNININEKKRMIIEFLNSTNSDGWNISDYSDKKGETGYIAACRQIELLTLELSSLTTSSSSSISDTKKQVIESYIEDYQTTIGLLVNDFGVDVTIKDENGKFGSDFIPNINDTMKDLKNHLKHHESTYKDATVSQWFANFFL